MIMAFEKCVLSCMSILNLKTRSLFACCLWGKLSAKVLQRIFTVFWNGGYLFCTLTDDAQVPSQRFVFANHKSFSHFPNKKDRYIYIYSIIHA